MRLSTLPLLLLLGTTTAGFVPDVATSDLSLFTDAIQALPLGVTPDGAQPYIPTPLDLALETLPANASDDEIVAIFTQHGNNSTAPDGARGRAWVCGTEIPLWPLRSGLTRPDIHLVADRIVESYGDAICWQTDWRWGRRCIKYWTHNALDLYLCGVFMTGVKCKTMAWSMRHLAAVCKYGNNQAGGAYIFEEAQCRVHVL